MKDFKLGEGQYICYEGKDENLKKDFCNGKKVCVELLNESDCEILLYLLSNEEYPSSQEENLLEIAYKASGEIYRTNSFGQKEPIMSYSFLNISLVIRGIQIELEKNEILKCTYVKFLYDEYGAFGAIRDLREEIEILEDRIENNL